MFCPTSRWFSQSKHACDYGGPFSNARPPPPPAPAPRGPLQRRERLEGCFQSTGKNGVWRLEKRLSGKCWRSQNGVGGQSCAGTEVTGALKSREAPPPTHFAGPSRQPQYSETRGDGPNLPKSVPVGDGAFFSPRQLAQPRCRDGAGRGVWGGCRAPPEMGGG